ncbi:MAG: sugar ABC transporter ATP-binding protein [Actinomycetota bacterium]|nr:sugar ABC transporter ATP-binding protein [Actinomycetota bacterium]
MTDSYAVHGLAKVFGGVTAVAEASFAVEEGTVHGVIGKNGAGKSVLMNMVAGVLTPSAGSLTVGGEAVDNRRWSSRAAADHGVALVPQEPPELPFMTVEDFLFLGDRRCVKGGVVQRRMIRRKVSDIDERLALRVTPTDQMAALPIEVQQLLAFGKAVFLEEARVVLLDEITASLSGERREALLAQLRELRAGRSFTLISHRISEIMAACDNVTVMRDGVTVETVSIGSTTAQELAAAIVGDADTHVRVVPETRLSGRPVLELTQVSSPPLLDPVDLVVHEHEVLGLAGVEGSGKDELLEVLAGLRHGHGRIVVDGKEKPIRSPRAAARAGVAYLPKKREEFATIHAMSVLDNMVLPVAGAHAGFLGTLRDATLRRLGAPLVEQMAVKTPSLETDIDNLSGGNKQKVMLSRLQLMRPRVYALNEPTRGVDIATIPELLRVVRERLTVNSAVVMTSESEEELLETCDRVLVFVRGRIVRELRRGDPDFSVGAIYRTGQGVTVS